MLHKCYTAVVTPIIDSDCNLRCYTRNTYRSSVGTTEKRKPFHTVEALHYKAEKVVGSRLDDVNEFLFQFTESFQPQ
jgi:hypothetical protein